MMPNTDLGRHAVNGYARYLGVSAADFIKSMAATPTPTDVATAIIDVVTRPDSAKGKVFVVTGKGLEAVAA
jgi:hypothetical protein